MKEIDFPQWPERLAQAQLSAAQRQSFAITVRGGKGDKDRFVPLAHVAVEPLRAHLAKIRRIFDHDREAQERGDDYDLLALHAPERRRRAQPAR